MTAILDPTETGTDRPTAPRPTPVATEPARTAPVATTPAVAVPEAVEPARTPPARPLLSKRGLRRYGLAMIGLFVLSQVIIPVPDGPIPVRPDWVLLTDNVVLFGLLALAVGTVLARRWALWAGLAVGAPMLAVALSCPVTGHHEYAAWWFAELALVAALAALPAALLRRTRA